MAIDRENGLARDLSNHEAPAMRMPLLERRTGLIGIALALIAGTGGAVLAHNSFAYSDPGLGRTAGVDGELIATMGDGTIRAAVPRLPRERGGRTAVARPRRARTRGSLSHVPLIVHPCR